MKESFMMKCVVTNKAIYVHVTGNGWYLKSFICKYGENEQSKSGIVLCTCKHNVYITLDSNNSYSSLDCDDELLQKQLDDKNKDNILLHKYNM